MSVVFTNGFEGRIEGQPTTTDIGATDCTYVTGRWSGGTAISLVAGTVKIYTIPLTTQPRVGVWIYIPTTVSIAAQILRLYRGATLHMAVQLETNLTLSLRRNSTSVATYATPLTAAAWHLIEFTSTLADSGGVATVWLDGVQAATFTGDTRNGGSDTQFDGVGIHTGNSNNVYWDDLYVDDAAFRGNCRVVTLRPDASGDSTEFTPTTGSNYSRVDAVAAPGEYVYSQASGDTDLYNMEALASDLTDIKAVSVKSMVLGRATSKTVKAAVKSSSSTAYGTAAAPSTGMPAASASVFNTDPATSVAWTAAGVNALQAGLETV